MSAFRIFSRLAELLDVNVTRATAAWLRLNADGTVSERTASQTRDDLGLVIGTNVAAPNQDTSGNAATASYADSAGTSVSSGYAESAGYANLAANANMADNANPSFKVWLDLGAGPETAQDLLVGNGNGRFFDAGGNAFFAMNASYAEKAAYADELRTPRTINGTSFNGSSHIGQDLRPTARPTFAGVTSTAASTFTGDVTMNGKTLNSSGVWTTTYTSTQGIYLLGLSGGGSQGIGLDSSGLIMRTTCKVAWGDSATSFHGAESLVLARDGAGILAQRLGAAAQASRIYGTFTARGAGTTSLEAVEIKAQAAGSFIIQSLKGNIGGTARDLEFRHGATDTNGTIVNGTLVMTITSSGLTLATPLAITSGGTGATSPSAARTNLGLDPLLAEKAKSVEVFDFTRTTAPAGATGGSGTWAWNLPTGAKTMKIFTVGAGGGGGSGKKDAALTARYGGGGGSGGGTTIIELPVGTFTSLSIAVGLGGTGGVSQTVTASNGNTGGNGGNSTVSVTVSSNTFSICQGGGGNGGAGGSATSGNGGFAPAFSMWSSAGGAGGLGAVGGDGAMSNAYPISLGGAGGGGVSTLNAFGNGNRGSINSTFLATTFGATQTIEGGNGTQGAVINAAAIYGYSGGGGGAGSSVGTGGNGANGTGYGAGGGGGGGSLGNSGAGGNGGDGFVRIIVFY